MACKPSERMRCRASVTLCKAPSATCSSDMPSLALRVATFSPRTCEVRRLEICSPAASSLALLMRCPVDRRCSEVPRAVLLISNWGRVNDEAMLVFTVSIESLTEACRLHFRLQCCCRLVGCDLDTARVKVDERLRLKRADKNRRVDARVVQADVPVHVRAGGAAGGADPAEYGAACQLLAEAHVGFRQVTEHADKALAVVDEHRIAVKEVVTDQRYLAGGRCLDRCASGHGKVQARMGVA